MSNVITQAELRDAVGTSAVTVVDALPLRAYQRRHLPGAVNLPAEDIARAADVLPDRSSPIVVYSTDTDCDRGPGLAELLTGLGYRDIRLYAEGIEDWAAAGLPIESDAQR